MKSTKPLSLYIHLPFCKSFCTYCDFPRLFYKEDFLLPYLAALKKEITNLKIDHPLKTIYIGGGDPLVLPTPYLEDFLKFLLPYSKDTKEFTIEGNPEDVTKEKASLLLKYNVNRVSLGGQTSNDERLKALNRKHRFSDLKNAVSILKEAGFHNISIDMIYGYPKQTLDDVKRDIQRFYSLDVPHFSTYSLTINPGTKLYYEHNKEREDDFLADSLTYISFYLRKRGYEHYEVSSFSKLGYQSEHNLTYWRDMMYYAAGIGASGFDPLGHYVNTRSYPLYLKGEGRIYEEKTDKNDEIEYFFLTTLRTKEGFYLKEFKDRFKEDFLTKYADEYRELYKQGLLKKDKDHIHVTEKGYLLLDRILLSLFPSR